MPPKKTKKSNKRDQDWDDNDDSSSKFFVFFFILMSTIYIARNYDNKSLISLSFTIIFFNYSKIFNGNT